MATQDKCCSIVPYFKVHEGKLDEFKGLCERFSRADTDRMVADKVDFCSFAQKESFHIETYRRFYNRFGIGRLFRPVGPLQRQIDALSSTFDSCIGVHIRRTDHRPAVKYSPTALFFERMKAEIGLDDRVKFFVSTDDPQTERQLRAVFGDRIIAHEKRSYDRRRAEAIEDALVDLYCLSRTVRIFGSLASTFSTVAAELGDIPIEIVATPHPEKLVNAGATRCGMWIGVEASNKHFSIG